MMMRVQSLLFIFLFLLTACLPEQTVRQPVTNEINSTSTDSNNSNQAAPDSATNNAAQEDAYWFSANNVLQTLTIDFDNNRSQYILGGDVDAFLKATTGIKGYQTVNNVSTPIYNYRYEDTYCLEVEFVQGTQTPNSIRVLAIPSSSLNIQTGERTRYFRVNLANSSGNADACNKFIESDSGLLVAPTFPTVYETELICPSCKNIISSSGVKLYRVDEDNNTLKLVNDGQVKTSGLTLRVDMNGQAGSGISNCSDSDCQAQGFDCCINGQCVNEASTILSGIAADQAGYQQALAELANDPQAYLNYPQFFYACLERPPSDDGNDPVDPADPTGEADARLAALVSDFNCVEQLREFAVEVPYVKDYVDGTLPVVAASYSNCNTSTPSDNMHYQNVLRRLYDECGCAEKNNLSIMVRDCPAYYYVAEYERDVLGNETEEIRSISCFTPPVDQGPVPFEDRDVIVNARTAPHRFFNENNEEYTLQEPLPDGASSVQEYDGDSVSTSNFLKEFTYLDDERLFPVNGSFNMNSILGNMDVNLTKARPAKVIDVEFDKVYYLAAIDGFYTPCPSCSKDAWFSNFSAFPSTNQGHGIRATGFTTSRSEWRSNSSLANYEDLIFGRACWLPPTMLPYSHRAVDGDNGQDQRINRLITQSALYVNGYQRDWFGFNKGALIGSFDGVSWFAIGKSRVARATSNKLFLAINAPFADLSNPNDLTVHVAEYDFISTAAKYDYKDTGEINDVDQNDGGLCQKFHQCTDDTDCITQLGWEYACVNVTQQKTKWPKFEPIGATEVNDDERIGNIVEFLNQGELPPDTPTTKRCVYRGMGAPCRVDLQNVTSPNLRRSLACAPNFFCAPLTSNVFNDEVARYGNSVDAILEPKNHLIGRDANQLGRPKEYIGANNSLPSAVINTLQENLREMDPNIANNEGLCVPGKLLPEYLDRSTSVNVNQIDQLQSADPNGRTDYISQISGCNSTLYNIDRYSSCPIIGEDGNYLHLSTNYLNDNILIDIPELGSENVPLNTRRGTQYYATQQNVCGLENLDSTTSVGPGADEETIRENSAFKLIQGRDLASSDTQIEPILTQNACFRRAGAVCHTDLDCAPGKKHFEVIDVINPAIFGNEAERKYWEEYLVCGQARPEPRIDVENPDSFAAFNEYDMSNNRCCREVGKDLTIYTEDTPNQDETIGLRTDIYGGVNPNHPNRYSRYMVASPLMSEDDFSINGDAHIADVLIRPSANTDHNTTTGVLTSSPNITDEKQWISVSEAAGRTCCGGGWVRKFADGSNDWSINRLNLDVSQFKCLNYRTPLYLTEYPEAFDTKEVDINRDFPYYCADPSLAGAGCAQYTFEFGDSNDAPKLPILDDTTTTMTIDTDLSQDGRMSELWADNEWAFFGLFSTDSYPNTDSTVMDFSNPFEEKDDDEFRQTLAVRIPSFVTFRNDNWPNSTTPTEFPAPGATGISSGDLAITVALSDPLNDGNPGNFTQCRRLTLSADEYNCASNADSWGGLCDYNVSDIISRWEQTTTDNGININNETCVFFYDQRTRELRVSYVPEVLCESVTYPYDGNCPDEMPDGFDPQFYSGNVLSLRITFTAPGTLKWEQDQHAHRGGALDDADLDVESIFHHRRSSKPGNVIYYLKKFAKFEYLGIPQMTYEPIFCNDNYQKMVPGLFKPELDNTAFGGDNNGILTSFDWMNSTRTFRDNNIVNGVLGNWKVEGSPAPQFNPNTYYGEDVKRVATSEEVDHPQIFSASDFKCCLPLGSQVGEGEGNLCCSGYATEGEEGGSTDPNLTNNSDVYRCKLPIGTNLNVYFNRFVSGEGNDVLEADDFDPRTGEPVTTIEVQNKLRELGQEHCEGDDGGTVRQGGAFGDYDPEPTPAVIFGSQPKVFGIVDSQFDTGTANNVPAGNFEFQSGFRWNHHLYCSGDGGN